MKRKIIIAIAAMLMMMTVIVPSFAAGKFSDLPKGHWAYKNIMAMSDAGIIKGYADKTFRPETTVTTAEFIKMAVVSSGEDAEIAKAPHHWARNYYYKGLENGWYSKKDIGEGALDQPIARQHMALIASRIINPDEKAVEGYSELLKSISDMTAKDRYEFEVVTAYGEGVLTGYTDGTFRPMGTLTRAESAAVIQRLMDESVRIVPDIALIEAKNKEREEAEKNRPKSKLETVRENATSSIEFDPDVDLLPDGSLTEEKAIYYLDKVLDSILFSGSAGKYYMTVTFPDLPEGFSWGFTANTYLSKDAIKKDKKPWCATNGNTLVEEYKMVAEGTVKRPVLMDSLKDIGGAGANCWIIGKDNKEVHGYGFGKWYSENGFFTETFFAEGYRDLDLGVMENRLHYDYDVDRHFTWK
ncbi:MAG: S-layer homology domain-containing protein [Anaerovoracaceae bacterium]|jgi:hypothetical protein